jgi:hypothetical protein
MAGFPEGGNVLKSAIDLGCAGPVSLSSYVVKHKGPGREQNERLARLTLLMAAEMILHHHSTVRNCQNY